MNAFTYSTRNPFRPPHWRWERAGLIAAGEVKLSRQQDDAWVRRAAVFRRDLANARTPAEYDALFCDQPELYAAHEFWKARKGRHKNSVNMVCELEARLLVKDTSFALIGTRMSIDPVDVHAYEQLFFSVRDRLENRSYIIQQVIGERLHSGNLRLGADRQVFWMIYGYVRGNIALDRLIDTTNEVSAPTDYQDLLAAMRDEGDDNLAIAFALATRTIDPTDKFKQPEIITAYQKSRELDAVAGSIKGQTQAMTSNVAAMLSTMHFEVPAHNTVGSMVIKSVGVFEGTSAELRGDELVSMSLGGPPPDRDDIPPAYPALPPKRPKKTVADGEETSAS